MAVNKSSPPWPSYAPLVHSRFIIGRLKAAVKAAAMTALYPTVARGTYEKTARRAKSHIAPCPRRIRDFSGSLPPDVMRPPTGGRPGTIGVRDRCSVHPTATTPSRPTGSRASTRSTACCVGVTFRDCRISGSFDDANERVMVTMLGVVGLVVSATLMPT